MLNEINSNNTTIFPGGSDCKESAAVQETQVWSLALEEPLEKGMATHFRILTWRILWTEEPGGLESMGLQRARYDWATNSKWHMAIHHSLPAQVGNERFKQNFFQCAFNFLAKIEYTCIIIYPWPYCSKCSIQSSFSRETRQTGMPKKR